MKARYWCPFRGCCTIVILAEAIAISTRTDLSWNWSRPSVAILIYLECLIIYVCFMIWWKIMSPVGSTCVMHRDLESWSMEYPQMFWNSALSGWVLLSSTNRNCQIRSLKYMKDLIQWTTTWRNQKVCLVRGPGDYNIEILKYKKMTAISVLTSSALVAKLPWHTVCAFQFLVLGLTVWLILWSAKSAH